MTSSDKPISRFVRYALCSMTALLFALPVALGVAVLLYDKNYHNPSHLSESNSIALGVRGLFSLTFSAVASGTIFGLLVPFLMFTVLNRFARVHPKGLRLTYAFMALGLCLMWSAPQIF